MFGAIHDMDRELSNAQNTILEEISLELKDKI